MCFSQSFHYTATSPSQALGCSWLNRSYEKHTFFLDTLYVFWLKRKIWLLICTRLVFVFRRTVLSLSSFFPYSKFHIQITIINRGFHTHTYALVCIDALHFNNKYSHPLSFFFLSSFLSEQVTIYKKHIIYLNCCLTVIFIKIIKFIKLRCN